MSSEADERMDTVQCCAGCGVKEDSDDDIKLLKNCTACYLVKYCSVKCQRNHRPKHKRACKKRVAELRDELLFKQPESTHLGDCPICCLPLPIHPRKSTMMVCCSKLVCNGCSYSNQNREMEEKLKQKCPFCRCPLSETYEQDRENLMRRVSANNPFALSQMGWIHEDKGDYKSAFELYTRAAGLGHANAHFQLALLYYGGKGVEKDEKKKLHHLEEAAIGGHPRARSYLSSIEGQSGRQDRGMKHLIIAAKMGCDHSLDALKNFFKMGVVDKDGFAAALRAHQAAVDATKSQQRHAAEAAEALWYTTMEEAYK